jgi:hypothetical protein
MPSEQLFPKSDEATARREFLGQIGKATVTAPAVALLLAATAKNASADDSDKYEPKEKKEKDK